MNEEKILTYKAYIKETPGSDDNIYKVRIPFLEDNTNKEMVFKAVSSHVPGIYDEYKVGDCVFVTFENNEMEMAIILGALYVENDFGENSSNIKRLTVSEEAILPENTKLGKYSVNDFFVLYNRISESGSSLDYIVKRDWGDSGE